MKIVIQRVKSAKVTVSKFTAAEIGHGLLLLVGIARGDGQQDINKLVKKVLNLRIFEDEQGKMNLDVTQVGGSILSVSQFTLHADTKKGNRPSFVMAEEPHKAKGIWKDFNDALTKEGLNVKAGVFSAHMDVHLVNDGPVTIILDSRS